MDKGKNAFYNPSQRKARWWTIGANVLILTILLAVAVVQDIRCGRISNRLILTGLMMGLLCQIEGNHLSGIFYFLRNVSIPIILFYLLFQMRVLGAGDIKLFSMIGSLVTIQELCRCMLYGFFAGGAAAAFFLVVTPKRRQRCMEAWKYLWNIVKTGRVTPYVYSGEQVEWKFAFSLPVAVGTLLALYGF